MKRLMAIAVLLFSGVALAQINGVPASVTSTNGNFRATFNPPASVTSLGPNGWNVPRFNNFVPPCTGVGINPAAPPCVIGPPVQPFRHGHRGRKFVAVPYAYPLYPYYDPYMYSDYTQPEPPPQPAPAPEPEPSAPAPTIFDRAGNGYNRSALPAAPAPSAEALEPSREAAPPTPPAIQETVTLVFRDGRRLDITNYAIMGSTLFDLTPGHVPRKIALTELDLPATIKLNDERGVDFQLPKSHA